MPDGEYDEQAARDAIERLQRQRQQGLVRRGRTRVRQVGASTDIGGLAPDREAEAQRSASARRSGGTVLAEQQPGNPTPPAPRRTTVRPLPAFSTVQVSHLDRNRLTVRLVLEELTWEPGTVLAGVKEAHGVWALQAVQDATAGAVAATVMAARGRIALEPPFVSLIGGSEWPSFLVGAANRAMWLVDLRQVLADTVAGSSLRGA